MAALREVCALHTLRAPVLIGGQLRGSHLGGSDMSVEYLRLAGSCTDHGSPLGMHSACPGSRLRSGPAWEAPG